MIERIAVSLLQGGQGVYEVLRHVLDTRRILHYQVEAVGLGGESEGGGHLLALAGQLQGLVDGLGVGAFEEGAQAVHVAGLDERYGLFLEVGGAGGQLDQAVEERQRLIGLFFVDRLEHLLVEHFADGAAHYPKLALQVGLALAGDGDAGVTESLDHTLAQRLGEVLGAVAENVERVVDGLQAGGGILLELGARRFQLGRDLIVKLGQRRRPGDREEKD